MSDCQFFQVIADVHPDGDQVQITQREFVPENFAEASIPAAAGTTAGVHEARYNHAVSFYPACFASRGANELFVAGPPIAPDTDSAEAPATVLEKWVIVPSNGSPYTVRSTHLTPIGTPAPLSTLDAHVEGGTYIVAEQRRPPRVRKTALGQFEFETAAIEVDPEGRFILLLSPSAGILYRLDLVNHSGQPVSILDATTRPELHAGVGLYAARFGDALKRYVVVCGTGDRIVLGDAQNDGVLDQVEVFSDAAFHASTYGDYDSSVENYRSYSLLGLFQ